MRSRRYWARCGIALAVAGFGASAPASARLTAGAGNAEIGLTTAMLPIDGFAKMLDPLHARVVVLADGPAKVAIVVVDQTSLSGETVAELKQVVARATGTDTADVLVCASHTFSAPHYFGARTMPGTPASPAAPDPAANARGTAYHVAIVDAVGRAAADAARGLRPARLGVGTGSSDVNVSRNLAMADGWWLGANDAEPSDKTVGVLRIDGEDKRPIALLVNYAVQSSVMDHATGNDSPKGVTADLGGAAVAHVERWYGNGAVSLFLVGAAGDQMPDYVARRNVYDAGGKFTTIDIGDAGYPLVALQGERLGAEAVRVAQALTPAVDTAALHVASGSIPLDSQERPRELGQIKPSRDYKYVIGRKVDAPYWLLRIGDTVLVGVQAELSAATGEAIRRQSPFARTMVMTMVNGAAKYMPEAAGYRKNTYQAMNSGYGPGSAEIFARGIVAALKTLHAVKR